jgi:ankyrin repeat protein
MPPKPLTGSLRERKDPTEELKELAVNKKLTDEELQPLVRQAIDDGANVNAMVEYDGVTRPVLHCFIVQGKLVSLEELLIQKPDTEKFDSTGETALQTLVVSFVTEPIQIKMIRQLILAGADIDSTTSKIPSPLFRAIYFNLTDVVKELLRFPKKPNLERPFSRFGTVLIIAVANGNEIITRDLIKAGAKLESKRPFDEATPLLVAAQRGQENTLRILVEAGANLDAKTK